MIRFGYEQAGVLRTHLPRLAEDETRGVVIGKVYEKHLQRYLDDSGGRQNMREKDTIDQMRDIVAGMLGERPMLRQLAGLGSEEVPSRMWLSSI